MSIRLSQHRTSATGKNKELGGTKGLPLAITEARPAMIVMGKGISSATMQKEIKGEQALRGAMVVTEVYSPFSVAA